VSLWSVILDEGIIKVDITALAKELLEAKYSGAKFDTMLTARENDLDLVTAYQIEREIVKLREAEGHKFVGRKIGMANWNTLKNLGLATLPWASMYDDTVLFTQDNYAEYSLTKLIAPKLEPEILMKLKSPLTAGRNNPVEVLQAVEWIALCYEVVDNPYPEWKLTPPDFVATFGYHTGLIVGTPRPIAGEDLAKLAEQLENCEATLTGENTISGGGKNVLGSPCLSLGELATALNTQPGADTLAAGELISTGTMLPPPFIAVGQTWRVELKGLDLPPLTAKFI
jgi:2-keto-4-pentenoate hydratase